MLVVGVRNPLAVAQIRPLSRGQSIDREIKGLQHRVLDRLLNQRVQILSARVWKIIEATTRRQASRLVL